jgi:acyl-CoA reductase-like NAD-dependent aldehyde dehydrogenase
LDVATPKFEWPKFAIPFDTQTLLVGGAWHPSASGATLVLENASDGSVLAHIARGDAADVDAAVTAAQAALGGEWGALTAAERSRVLGAIGRKVLDNVDRLAMSPQTVFADADLDAALPSLVNAGLQNAGQTCSAASRILVEREVYAEVRQRMAERHGRSRRGQKVRWSAGQK